MQRSTIMFEDLYEFIKNYNLDDTNIIIHDSDELKDKLLKILKKRIYDAKQAYIVLVDNNLTSDAILIAGHILETAATILYVNDSDTKYHAQKYIAKSSIMHLYSLFKNVPFAESLKASIEDTISSLRTYGSYIIKDNLTVKQSDKNTLNAFILNILSNIHVPYEAKTKVIGYFYELPTVSDNVRYFCKRMELKYKTKSLEEIKQPLSLVSAFYDHYCTIKHANIECCCYEELEADKLKPINFSPKQSIPIVAYCLDMIQNI